MGKYKITTNAVALSRAWTALNMIDISGVPQVNAGDNVEEVACLLSINIGAIPEAFNMFFQAITGESDKNFAETLTEEEAHEITINFCRSISKTFLSLIKKYLKESKELKDSIMLKTKVMQIEKMTEVMKNPEVLANMLKLLSNSQGQG